MDPALTRTLFLITSGFFLVIGLLFVLVNIVVVIQNWFTGRSLSIIPVFGGGMIFVGLLFFPNQYVRLMCWMAFVVDPGGLPFLPRLISRWRRKN